MIRPAALALAVFALAATTAHAEVPEDDIEQVLNELHEAASKADGKTYWSLYTPDAVFIGTDVTERWTLPEFKAYAEPFFSKNKGWTYKARSRNIKIADIDCRCVAWFDEVLDSPSYGTVRGSGSLVRVGADWKVSHYVLSFPVPNDIADKVVTDIKAFEAPKKP